MPSPPRRLSQTVGRLIQELEQQAYNKNRRRFKILEPLFLALGLANNVVLIFIFLIRKNHFALLQRIGWVYFLLAIPAIYAILIAQQEHKVPQYTVFLGIFLAFLAIEALYDWILKIPFREKMDWKQLVPYVALYLSMNYGFVVMVWKYYSLIGGIILLGLFVIQIIANIVSHPRRAIEKSNLGMRSAVRHNMKGQTHINPWWAALTVWGIVNAVNVLQAAGFLSRVYTGSRVINHIFGYAIIALAIPSVVALVAFTRARTGWRQWIGLAAFLVFVVFMVIVEYIWRVEFRSPIRYDILVPYLVLFFGSIMLMGLPMFRINRRLWLVTVVTTVLLLGSMGFAMYMGVG